MTRLPKTLMFNEAKFNVLKTFSASLKLTAANKW